jgi:DNA-binding CsgD family transcriptional regulator
MASLAYKGINMFCPPAGSFREGSREPYGELAEATRAMAMLEFCHTPVEHQLYKAMLAEVMGAKTRICAFSTHELMTLTKTSYYSTTRRAIRGLVDKLSIEQHKVVGGIASSRRITVHLIFTPEEIFARRLAAGLVDYPEEAAGKAESPNFGRATRRVVERKELTRREAQVALCCAEGLTNSKIGEKLYISEQTVKFHLRHVFMKFGVKRRTELISDLLTQVG